MAVLVLLISKVDTFDKNSAAISTIALVHPLYIAPLPFPSVPFWANLAFGHVRLGPLHKLFGLGQMRDPVFCTLFPQ